METYKKLAEEFTKTKISKLLPNRGGGISPKIYSEKLGVYMNLLKELDRGLVDLGTQYWKDRDDFVKDDVEKLHVKLMNSLTAAFKGN